MSQRRRRWRIRVASALGALLAGLTGAARAEIYYTPRAVLAAFFPASQRVTYRQFSLTPEARLRIARRIGAPLLHDSYTFYIALSNQTTVDGYALLDEAAGQYMPITFAVKLSPKGEVQRLEIMAYLEKYGSEVRDDRFRKQFVGKTVADPLLVGGDVVVVSGASISSRALTSGVRRALFLLDELVLHPNTNPNTNPNTK